MRVASFAIASLILGGIVGFAVGRRNAAPQGAQPQTRSEEPARPSDSPASHVSPPKSVPDRVAELSREKIGGVTPDLARELRSNPAMLRWALEELRRTAGTEAGELLAIVLGEVRDPAVEEAALELARAGHLLGFELLDRLNIENPRTRRAILDFVRTETRPEILGAAIYAIHRGVPSPAESGEVIGVLRPAAVHSDPEVRRRAVVALGEWGDVESAVGGLRDSSVDVRAGAAFVLGRTKAVFPAVLEALAARISDDREDWAVREQAWRSLATFPLDERMHDIWRRFRELHEMAGEGGKP